VAAGYGDPAVAPIIVADADLGLYGASASDLNFTQRIGEFAVSCLRFATSGLFACAKELDATGVDTSGTPDFHVGVFKGGGLPQKLTDFTPLLKLKDVRGPMPWLNNQPNGCAQEWATGDPANPGMASACQTFNACTKGGVTPLSAGAIQCGAATSAGGSAASGGTGNGSGGMASSGGTGNTAGAVVFGGDAGQKATGGTAGGPNPPASKDSGCSCRVQSPPSHGSVFWGAFASALFGLAAKRRKFSRRAVRE
jgi:MYXO-CTERM domain-containing protein